MEKAKLDKSNWIAVIGTFIWAVGLIITFKLALLLCMVFDEKFENIFYF